VSALPSESPRFPVMRSPLLRVAVSAGVESGRAKIKIEMESTRKRDVMITPGSEFVWEPDQGWSRQTQLELLPPTPVSTLRGSAERRQEPASYRDLGKSVRRGVLKSSRFDPAGDVAGDLELVGALRRAG
jgi:hypothetical protein